MQMVRSESKDRGVAVPAKPSAPPATAAGGITHPIIVANDSAVPIKQVQADGRGDARISDRVLLQNRNVTSEQGNTSVAHAMW